MNQVKCKNINDKGDKIMLKAGLIGFGGIAQAHRKAYEHLAEQGKIELVCAYDIRQEAFEEKVEINLETESSDDRNIRFYTDLEEMLKNEELDLVDIAVPSYLHRDYAIDMLKRGYNVMSEKPMALNFADCQKMLEAADGAKGHFMIGQCLRFYPQYVFLKDCIDSGKYGKVLSATFHRISSPPVWGWENWFMDYEKSGGCITDLHIHDVDMVRYLFGEPKAVSCYATSTLTKYDSCQTTFKFDDISVLAIGDWTIKDYRFSSGYRVNFEKSTIAFEDKKVTIYPCDGEPIDVELPKYNGIEGELSYYTDVINGKIENTKNHPTSAANTIKLIEKMKQSADLGGDLIKI